MAAQTPFLHLLHATLLHHSLVVFHELRHLFSVLTELLLVGGGILNLYVDKVSLLLGRLDRGSSSPILVGFIISSSSNEARIVHFQVKALLLYLMLVHYLIRLVLSLMGGDKIPLHFVRHFQLQPFIVEIEDLGLLVGVHLLKSLDVLGLHLLGVLVLDQLVLALQALAAVDASVFLALEVLIQVRL